MQYGVRITGRKWLGGEGVWRYCVSKRKGCWEPIAWVYAKGLADCAVPANVNIACDGSGHTIAVGGTIEGLRGFVERVSQNWEV